MSVWLEFLLDACMVEFIAPQQACCRLNADPAASCDGSVGRPLCMKIRALPPHMSGREKQGTGVIRPRLELRLQLKQLPHHPGTERTSRSLDFLAPVAIHVQTCATEPSHVRHARKSAWGKHTLPEHGCAHLQHRCWAGSPLQPGQATPGGGETSSLSVGAQLKVRSISSL